MMRDAPRFHFLDSVGNLLGLIALARPARYRLVIAIVGYLPVSVALTREPASEQCTVSLLQTREPQGFR